MPLGMFEMSLQQAIELKEKAQTATSNQKRVTVANGVASR
jgi:hypothetical protein